MVLLSVSQMEGRTAPAVPRVFHQDIALFSFDQARIGAVAVLGAHAGADEAVVGKDRGSGTVDAVKAPVGVDGNGHGVDQASLGKAAAEEISERNLYRWDFRAIPVHSQNEIAEDKLTLVATVLHGYPYMVNDSHSVDIGKNGLHTRLEIQEGLALPTRSELSGGHASLSLLSSRILRRYRSRIPFLYYRYIR